MLYCFGSKRISKVLSKAFNRSVASLLSHRFYSINITRLNWSILSFNITAVHRYFSADHERPNIRDQTFLNMSDQPLFLVADLALLIAIISLQSCVQVYISILFYSWHVVNSVSILYQRGIYPADSFKREQFYDMTLFKCENKELQEYLSKVLQQVKGTS